MGVITNWGSTPLSKDLLTDDNTIEIIVFYKIINSNVSFHTTGFISESAAATTAASDESEAITFQYSSTLIPDLDKPFPVHPEFVTMLDNDTLNIAYTKTPKVIALKLKIAPEYYGQLNITFTNPNFEIEQYHFCEVKIYKKGLNVPCTEQRSLNYSKNNITNERGIFYESVEYTNLLQHCPYSLEEEENYVYVDITLLFDATFTGIANIHATTTEHGETATLAITVIDSTNDYGDDPVDEITITADQITNFHVCKIKKMPLVINLPRLKTFPLTVEITLPSAMGAALFTIQDIVIEADKSDICCLNSPGLKVSDRYEITLSKTSDLVTFMQNNYAKIDLGNIVNGLYSLREGFENLKHNAIYLGLSIQMSDQNFEKDFTPPYHDMNFTVKSKSFEKVFEFQMSGQNPSDRKTKRASIIMNMIIQNEKEAFEKNDKIIVESTISHTSQSCAEAQVDKITAVKLVLPKWLRFDASGTCKTNYTSNNECIVEQSGDGHTYFIFKNGICFSDFIGLNFSLSVDEKAIPSGLDGLVQSAIVTILSVFNHPGMNINQLKRTYHLFVVHTTRYSLMLSLHPAQTLFQYQAVGFPPALPMMMLICRKMFFKMMIQCGPLL